MSIMRTRSLSKSIICLLTLMMVTMTDKWSLNNRLQSCCLVNGKVPPLGPKDLKAMGDLLKTFSKSKPARKVAEKAASTAKKVGVERTLSDAGLDKLYSEGQLENMIKGMMDA